MQKNRIVLLMLIGVLTFSLAIAGCGDIGDMGELEGTWERGGGMYKTETLTFSGDIVTYYDSMSTVNNGIRKGSYTVDGATLTITMSGGNSEEAAFALSSNRRTLIIHGSFLDGEWTKK